MSDTAFRQTVQNLRFVTTAVQMGLGDLPASVDVATRLLGRDYHYGPDATTLLVAVVDGKSNDPDMVALAATIF